MRKIALLVVIGILALGASTLASADAPVPRPPMPPPIGRQLTVTTYGAPAQWWPGSNEACGNCMPRYQFLPPGLKVQLHGGVDVIDESPVQGDIREATTDFVSIGEAGDVNHPAFWCSPFQKGDDCRLALLSGGTRVSTELPKIVLPPSPSMTRATLQFSDGVYFQGTVDCQGGCLSAPSIVKITTTGNRPTVIANTSLITCPGYCPANPIGFGTYSVKSTAKIGRACPVPDVLIATLYENDQPVDSAWLKAPCVQTSARQWSWERSVIQVPDLHAVDVAA